MFKTYLGMGDKNGGMLLSDGCGKEKRGKLLKNCGAASVGEYHMKIIRFYQLNDDVNSAPLRVLKLTFGALALRQIYIRI